MFSQMPAVSFLLFFEVNCYLSGTLFLCFWMTSTIMKTDIMQL